MVQETDWKKSKEGGPCEVRMPSAEQRKQADDLRGMGSFQGRPLKDLLGSLIGTGYREGRNPPASEAQTVGKR